jgi:site-specific DNA recombinase
MGSGRMQLAVRVVTGIGEAEAALARLYMAIENGVGDIDDAVLRDRVSTLKLRRDDAGQLLRLLEGQLGSDGSIEPAKVDGFVKVAAAILGDDQDVRGRPLIQLLVRKAVLADGDITLSGDPSDLARAVAAAKNVGAYKVPSYVREWRTRRDSNLRLLHRRVTLTLGDSSRNQ